MENNIENLSSMSFDIRDNDNCVEYQNSIICAAKKLGFKYYNIINMQSDGIESVHIKIRVSKDKNTWHDWFILKHYTNNSIVDLLNKFDDMSLSDKAEWSGFVSRGIPAVIIIDISENNTTREFH